MDDVLESGIIGDDDVVTNRENSGEYPTASIVVEIEFLSNVTFDMLKFIPFVDKVVYTHVNVPAVVL